MKVFSRLIRALVALAACALSCYPALAHSDSAHGEQAAVLKASTPSLAERAKLLSESFVEVRDVAALPASCLRGFAALTHTRDAELANPGQPYQATDVIAKGPRLPWRRLLIGAVSNDRCVVFYEIGGFAPYRAAMILDTSQNGPATLTWGGADGKDPADAHALIAQIVEGAFTQPRGY